MTNVFLKKGKMMVEFCCCARREFTCPSYFSEIGKNLGADSDCDVWGRIKKNQRGEEQPNAAIKRGFGERTIYLGIPDIRGILFFHRRRLGN